MENVLLPPHTLQLLVENGIRHGLKGLDKIGELLIRVTEEEGYALICVNDNGVGIPPERVEKLLHRPISSQGGTGIAFYNVNQRLVYYYGEESSLHIESQLNQGTTIWFKVPIKQTPALKSGVKKCFA